MKYQKELDTCLFAFENIRSKILEIYNSNDLGVEIKSDNSPVTKADKYVDDYLRKLFKSEFPTYSLLTEESKDDLSRLNNDYVFIIDPIDGTKEFVVHDDEFTVNIGLAYKHEAVFGIIFIPVTGEIYYASKGYGAFQIINGKHIKIKVNKKTSNLTLLSSRFHSTKEENNLIHECSKVIKNVKSVGSSIKGCLIAKGEAEISLRVNPCTKEWDTCAMQVIVEEAGGFLLEVNGKPIKYNRIDVYNRNSYIICNTKENFKYIVGSLK